MRGHLAYPLLYGIIYFELCRKELTVQLFSYKLILPDFLNLIYRSVWDQLYKLVSFKITL